jgi:hypothetical protein
VDGDSTPACLGLKKTMLMSLTAGSAHPGRGDALGGFLSRRTRMLPVQRERRTGKEVPPERARTTRKKGRSAAAELPKGNAETCLGQDGTVCPGSVEDHANAAVRGGRMKRCKVYYNHPIDRQKCADHESARREVVIMPAKLLWRKAPHVAARMNAITEANSHRRTAARKSCKQTHFPHSHLLRGGSGYDRAARALLRMWFGSGRTFSKS